VDKERTKHVAEAKARAKPAKARAKTATASTATLNANDSNRNRKLTPPPRLKTNQITRAAVMVAKKSLHPWPWRDNYINGRPHLPSPPQDATPVHTPPKPIRPTIGSTVQCMATTPPTMQSTAEPCSETKMCTPDSTSRPGNPETAPTQQATTTCNSCVLASTRGTQGAHTPLPPPLRRQLRG
jgi:hypothetical protein